MNEYVHEDKTTIHEYVTSPSLDPVTASTPDEHGVYPINPLGFPNTNVCDDDKECLGTGNPEFPQSRNFSFEIGDDVDVQYVEVATNVDTMSGTTVHLPVEYFAPIQGLNITHQVTVNGDITDAIGTLSKVSFANAGYDDYSVTNLIAASGQEKIKFDLGNGAEFVDGKTKFSVNASNCTITGHVGPGRIAVVLELSASNLEYVLLTGQNNSAENGLYKVTGEDEPWVKLASVGRVKGERVIDEADDPYNYPSSLDNTNECGHVRHGYSDREVAEYVDRKARVLVDAAIHPMSIPGDLNGAGQLTRWFVECGNIELGHSHQDGSPVTITGFGLGGVSSGVCTYGKGCTSLSTTPSDNIPVETPTLVFSIGTTRHAEPNQLPRDWPFTDEDHDYASDDNNITLLKSVAHTNRIHVCVNNDFTPNADDTTTPKRTFVHLPAPINTSDGDEFEVTVSLPVVHTPNQYGPDSVKNLSAYYEYVSTPRVIVLSGYWKFSDTKVTWNESPNISERTFKTGIIDITGDDVHPFIDKAGIPLGENTQIRFTLDGGLNCPRYTDMTGVLQTNEDKHITIVNLERYPYSSRLRDTRMSICGVAYLDPNDDGETTGTDLLMGLHSRNDVTLGSDSGSKNHDRLDEYNKFIKPLAEESDTSRKGICEHDARQVVATVYPTVTNTFPWAVVGRHKMKHLDRLMTDEWDLGDNSISAMIWTSNRKLIDFDDTVEFFGYRGHGYGFTADTMPIRYSRDNFTGYSDKSVIGSQVRIKFSELGYDGVTSNPVRQARKAVSMFADDFRKLRMFHGNKLPKVTSASALEVSGEPVNTDMSSYFSGWNPAGVPSTNVTGNRIASAAWLSKARHLPEYVITSGQDLSADGNSLIGANPFVDEPVSNRYSAVFAKNTYGNGYYETKDGHEIIPCEIKLLGVPQAFAYRSVITARVESDSDAVLHALYADANRVAELQKVSLDKWKNSIDFDITTPYDYLVDSNDYEKWMDIYSATSNVFSIDTIPIIDDMNAPSLPQEQKVMLSGDPLSSYNWETNNSLDFVATNLPYYDDESPRSTALTNILRRMVSPYGAKMPVRFWDGTRVAIATNGVKNNNIASLTRLVWPESECDMSSVTRSDIIADEFMAKTANSNTIDVNINHATMDSTLHANWSAPPAKVGRNWYSKTVFNGTDDCVGPSGYVRVFMKFKFSSQAGRWYTVDYRQVPMSYLTPLYGANALEEKLDGVRIWTESMCESNGEWKEVLMHPYSKYAPMDINPDVIPHFVENAPVDSKDIELENNTDLSVSEVSLPRLCRPYLPVSEGGMGLNAPCDVNGNTVSSPELADMPHANFWSVRKHLRPAVSVMDGTDIPGVGYEIGEDEHYHIFHTRSGGTMGDSVLWGQFDFPQKNKLDANDVEYNIPETRFENTL